MEPQDEDANKYGPFYNLPNDSRIFIPIATGWSVNIARPLGKAIVILTAVLIAGIVIWAIIAGILNSNEPNRQR